MTVSKVTIPDYSFKCNIWEFSIFSTSLPILTFWIILTLMSMRQYHITVLIYISQWLIILNLFHVFNDHIFIYISSSYLASFQTLFLQVFFLFLSLSPAAAPTMCILVSHISLILITSVSLVIWFIWWNIVILPSFI